MKKIFRTLTSALIVCLVSQPARAKVVNLNFPNENIKMSMNILASKKNTNVKLIYFEGLADCPIKTSSKENPVIQRCLKFHTQFSQDEWSYVPVKLITPFKPTSMYKYLGNVPELKQGRKETYKWGTVYNWHSLTFGSSHYFFFKPRTKNYAIQIGPIAGMVLINYDFKLDQIKWE